MTGIYKITNIVTGNIYIGKSVDIERRIREHKTPKGAVNKRIGEDYVRYGKDKFVFEVVEICDEKDLNARELFFIKTLLPYYNTVGKPASEETRKKISETVKRHWKSLSDEEKERFIRNNLIGPKKGHKVSEETREKLRQANLGKRICRPVIIVETGEEFFSPRECAKYLGVSSSAVLYNLEGKTQKTKGYRIRYKKCRD